MLKLMKETKTLMIIGIATSIVIAAAVFADNTNLVLAQKSKVI
jgi:hypothetical protein